jgi:hypothetical protein
MSEGLFGLAGVIIGALVTWAQGAYDRRKQRKLDAQYLAIRVVCILDKYVADCAAACGDAVVVDDEGRTFPAMPTPALLNYPEDVDWRVVEPNLMYGILSLPRDIAFAGEYLDSIMEDTIGPDIDPYLHARTEKYGALGLQAAALALKLRGTYSIPATKHPDWDPVAHIKYCLSKQKEQGRLREEEFQKAIQSAPVER